MFRISTLILAGICLLSFAGLFAQENINNNKFRQLGQELPTPNSYRNAAGAPGHAYWQQRADYNMEIEIDDETQVLTGLETITYYNNSPDVLEYIWLQLDQNVRAQNSLRDLTQTTEVSDSMTFKSLRRLFNDYDGGFKIDAVTNSSGGKLPYTINETMMRIDLPQPLRPGGRFRFKVKWWYNINDRLELGGRAGYEYFPEDDNYLYTIAQFFPRVVMYNDVYGWQHKQFLGRGEFALVFGDYSVSITVPSDHIVASTGVLQNPGSVLTATQRRRYNKAAKSDEPVIIVTEDEAREKETKRSNKKSTWTYKANNVRDFAFASSRKFIWDAMRVKSGNKNVMAMSYYPKEGNPLWEQFSTRVVAHTIKTYNEMTFDYPYPVAISVHTKRIGMEYPMICFNYGRPEKDGTYNARTKYGMLGVIIHEVGHFYFPMIVNSDERQWTWMDEGLNTFLQYVSEQQWEREYPSRRGPAHKIVDYMKGDKSNIMPIMTNSESIPQFGNNAYGKPATALNILRETILGRELFDFAFKTYSQRWMFKHPTPADFFRTMEDASGTDLDWFWRGWFYTTDHVDMSIERVNWFQVDTRNPEIENPMMKEKMENAPEYISDVRNREAIPKTVTEIDEKAVDFYTHYDPYETSILDKEDFQKYLSKLSEKDAAMLTKDMHYYEVHFKNIGGLVMPLILDFEYADGSKNRMHIPAEIWRRNSEHISKLFASNKEIKSIQLDPNLETADTDVSNNSWPRRAMPSRFKLFKDDKKKENPMQRDRRAKERESE
ncbi:MAG: M1 family metallopeptidase [Calditrichota bacterium]